MKANEIIGQYIECFHETNLSLLKKKEELIEALKTLEGFHLNISSKDMKKIMNSFSENYAKKWFRKNHCAIIYVEEFRNYLLGNNTFECFYTEFVYYPVSESFTINRRKEIVSLILNQEFFLDACKEIKVHNSLADMYMIYLNMNKIINYDL